jgi:histidyl-tRNA synthetase
MEIMLTGGSFMVTIKAPRGVRDILPEESWKWSHVLKRASRMADLFAYREIHLPVFEHTELFSRGIGENTDVVDKEMYTFKDRADRSLTLRPEATASIVRAYNEDRMDNGQQPVKLWTSGPMFRYERPQKGRYRQFWQLDFEALGSKSPYVDVEIIKLAIDLFTDLGLSKLDVVINSVGCPECRPDYTRKLKEYFRPRLDSLCKTCQDRFERNPLRILDCKNESCKKITENAPDIYESLCKDCRDHFDAVTQGLERLHISFHLDKRLVRGLDYYTKTAFEVLSGELGSQNAVCGGGRYDNLSDTVGGVSLPAVGFAAGLERIVLVMEQQNCSFGHEPGIEVYVISADNEARQEVLSLVSDLRGRGISCDMDFLERSIKAQFKSADNKGAAYACIIGHDEIASGNVTVKDLDSGKQDNLKKEELFAFLTEGLKDWKRRGKDR